MSTVIQAGNATNGGASISSDTAGSIQIQTGSTPTTAVTIDSSGNLLVGTTSSAGKLSVMSAASFTTIAIGTNGSYLTAGYLTNDSTYIKLGSSYGSSGDKFRVALQAPDNAATIDSSGNLFVGGTTQNTATAPVYAGNTCKAFVQFNANNGGTISLGASFNVSSVTRSTTGTFAISYTSALNNANYTVVGMCQGTSSNTIPIMGLNNGTNPTTTGVTVSTRNNSSAGLVEPNIASVNIFGV